MKIGDFYSVLSGDAALLEISGQAPISVGQRAEGGLDPPADRQRREPLGVGVSPRNLHLDTMALRGRLDSRPGVDPVDLDAVDLPARVSSPVQKDRHGLGVMEAGHSDQDGQNEAQRAGQDVTLDPLDLLVAVEAAGSLLRSGDDALRVQEPGRGFRRPTVLVSNRLCQQRCGIRPEAIVPEPVMPGAYRLPRAEILRDRPPLAAALLQIKAGVDHLPQIRPRARSPRTRARWLAIPRPSDRSDTGGRRPCTS